MKSGGLGSARGAGAKRQPSIGIAANARVQAAKLKATRHLLPKCTATAKSTGEQCGNLAMPNGKCHKHGGATPKGANWHRKQWPSGKRPNAIAKAEAKIRDHQKKAKRRERRLAQMTPEERLAHDAWHRSHRPTSPADRARARADREQNAAMRAFLSRELTAPPTSAEAEGLADADARRQATEDPNPDENLSNAFQGAFA